MIYRWDHGSQPPGIDHLVGGHTHIQTQAVQFRAAPLHHLRILRSIDCAVATGSHIGTHREGRCRSTGGHLRGQSIPSAESGSAESASTLR